MNHRATRDFWDHYRRLPEAVQRVADKNFRLLKNDPYHPSLHFKKLHADLWSARVGLDHRALATPVDAGTFVWFWIGRHDAYERLIG